MAFAILADLKAQLNIPSSDTTNDTELQTYVDASNEVCEAMVGPSASTAFTELYGTLDGSIILMRRPLISVTSVTPNITGAVALPTTAYTVDTVRGGLQITAGTGGDYFVVYNAGWAAIPARAKLALLIIGQHLWSTQRGGMIPSVVASEETVVMPGFGFAIPKRASELLASLSGPSTVPGIA